MEDYHAYRSASYSADEWRIKAVNDAQAVYEEPDDEINRGQPTEECRPTRRAPTPVEVQSQRCSRATCVGLVIAMVLIFAVGGSGSYFIIQHNDRLNALEAMVHVRMNELEEEMRENITKLGNCVELEISNVKSNLTNTRKEIASLKKQQFFVSCDEALAAVEGDVKVVKLHREIEVYCDMETDGGNWIVFQRRKDGSEDFYRTWEEYASGFGSRTGEFWLGLEAIHMITQLGEYELRIDLEDWYGNKTYAKYGKFAISEKSDNYSLIVEGYSGPGGDSMADNNDRAFSTEDSDHDVYAGNCASRSHGAWWYGSCTYSNLNGKYNDTADDFRGIFWYHWTNSKTYLLKGTEMKFRKK